MDVSPSTTSKAFKEILNQLALQITNEPALDLCFHRARHAPAQINRGNTERLIHRHQEIPGSQNPFLVADCLIERLAQSDPHILNRVVLIYVEVAITLQIEIECS